MISRHPGVRAELWDTLHGGHFRLVQSRWPRRPSAAESELVVKGVRCQAERLGPGARGLERLRSLRGSAEWRGLRFGRLGADLVGAWGTLRDR